MTMQDTHRITEIKSKIQALQFEEHAILDKYLGQDEGQWYKIGTWNCKKSPIGLCIYRFVLDPAWDNCIFCNKPNERK